MIKCKICGSLFDEDSFRGHPFKSHRIKIEDYFFIHYKKTDLFSGEKLAFKSVSQYLCSDFLNLRNLKSWVKCKDRETVKKYCLDWLENRKELKELRFPPCQVELKTLVFPPVTYLEEIFKQDGGYNKVAEGLGFFLRLEVPDKGLNLQKYISDKGISIIQDTRENKPLRIGSKTTVDTVSWGDYQLEHETGRKIRIERKGLADLISTVGKNNERFCREIERAEKDKGYLIVLVEEKFQNLLSFNFLPHISRRIKASPEFICHRIRDLCQNYENLQFLFCDGRVEAASLVVKLLKLGEKAVQYDLQAAYDIGVLAA